MDFKLLGVVCYLAVAVLAQEKYLDKYDNINIKEILETKRLLIAEFNCVMERGKCTPEGKALKNNLADAIETGCKKCTKAQSNAAAMVIEHLIQRERKMWKDFCTKYDPDGVWRKKYEAAARQKGIVISED